MNEWMNEWMKYKNNHLQPFDWDPYAQATRFWYQTVPVGQKRVNSFIPSHWIYFVQSVACGQYPKDDSAGHVQVAGTDGTVNMWKHAL